MQIITYKRKLKLTSEQQQRVDNWIGTCRFVYNLALEARITAWSKGKSIHKFELMKQLRPLRDIDWIADVPHQVLQTVIERLDSAYQTFFSGGGFPKWASKHRYHSLRFKAVQVDGHRMRLCKLGWVNTFKDRPILGTPRTATIIREHGGYYISITSRIEQALVAPSDENQAVGLHMGLTHFCTLSDGKHIANPKHFAVYERQLRIENRSLARKKLRSNNWYKQKARLRKLHAKIARVRKDFLHKQSHQITKNYGLIAVEDLNVTRIVAEKPVGVRLSKRILDASWATFHQQIEYKAERYGRDLAKVDYKYTSQTCSACGHRDEENRKSLTEFVCLSCKKEQDADVNAAKNILRQGMADVSQRDALACA